MNGVSAGCVIRRQQHSAKPTDPFAVLASQVKPVETDTTVRESADLGPIRHRFWEFEKQYPGAHCLCLYLAAGMATARPGRPHRCSVDCRESSRRESDNRPADRLY